MKVLLKKINWQDDEKIVLISKHSGYVVLPHVTISVLIILLDFFLMFYFITFGLGGLIIFLVVLGISIGYLFKIMHLWQSNLICLTNQRLIDVQQSKIGKPIIKFVALSKIKNISVDYKSWKQKIFKYGQLKLVIEKLSKPYVIYNHKQPEKILEAINAQIYKSNNPTEDLSDGEVDEAVVVETSQIQTDHNVLEFYSDETALDPPEEKEDTLAFTSKPLDPVENLLDQINSLPVEDQHFIIETLKAQLGNDDETQGN
ncbi:hypothetical protein COT97_00760 [Candidatus Falkowbacteria bacterium CG10_big_fil_rev_8_21_14_0_10_39_11]|uniref:DUF304 domain-containing protein n=1 Tax=Candidatus Falkowbacteria bacterium CG10_big_fil_rev_8_21_14_0_10_39_11 TaxID=1974565 RepID=A0A2H0V657_9BACT|nr:MAG: hypothetical protein COT97_00760 [Candidatus Falkowbacteria bacterium CG10_big_fil_rev_8_21_14_0_10_39_11]